MDDPIPRQQAKQPSQPPLSALTISLVPYNFPSDISSRLTSRSISPSTPFPAVSINISNKQYTTLSRFHATMLLWAGPTLFTLFSVFEHNGGYGQTRYHIHPPMAHGDSCMPSALFKGISTREVRPIWFRKQTLSYSFPLSLSLQAYCSKYI